ncbi:MAG: iron-sulfur cluster assembly accessory protein [Xanthomonadales bacterium]|nr:iron-sulfur cluster assembly accessory protein [Xanthomonadales bacterium]
MSIQLTTAALDRARRFLASEGDAVGLRLSAEKSGCSGWSYQIDLARELLAGDEVFEQDGVKLLVDATSLPLLAGTRIDFVSRGLGQEFTFDNPNATGGCGCGESFTVSRSA